MKNTKKVIKAGEVENYYFYHLDGLQEGKKIHWLIRHYLWFGDSLSKNILKASRRSFYKITKRGTQRFYKSLSNIKFLELKPGKDKVRYKTKEKYKEIIGINRAMFKALFTYTVFKKDYRDIIKKAIPKDIVVGLRKRLLNNQLDIAILSTPAINFLYISSWIYGLRKPDANQLYHIAKEHYSQKDALSINRTIYLLTHAVVGESLFYAKRISRELAVYRRMIRLADNLITNNYLAVKLDIKLEALMCSRMLGVKMKNEKKIIEEALRSKSKEGFFIVDRLNKKQGKTPHSFSKSEHRNILYVMATSQPENHLLPK